MGSGGTGSTGDSLPGGSGGPPAVGRGGGGGRGAWGMTIQSLAAGGSPVRKGEVIAEFDRENMLQRLDDFEALVTVSEANLQKLRADYDTVAHAHKTLIEAARQELEKSRLDYKTAVVRSAIEAERLKLTMEEAEARLQQMQKQVRFVETSLKAQMRNAEIDMLKANNELRRARANVERMVVKAPMAGIVVLHTSWRGGEFNQIKQGDMVRPGQTIMKVVNTGSMVIEAKVSQIDVERIRIGQKATVRFDAYPDLVLSASVYSVGAIAATPGFMANYVKEVPVKLRLDKVDPRVIPDLSVSVDVLLHSEEAQAVVPRSAIFQDSDAAAPYVMVREGNAWKRRIVELGAMNFTEAAVRQGVRPGEWVATAPPPQPSGNRSSGDTGNANASAASRSS
jgi:multidrug resistance efflux pump